MHSEMNRKWNGRRFMNSEWKSWQLKIFNMWCLFDLVFSPILLAVFSLLRKKGKGTSIFFNNNGKFKEASLTTLGEWLIGTLFCS